MTYWKDRTEMGDSGLIKNELMVRKDVLNIINEQKKLLHERIKSINSELNKSIIPDISWIINDYVICEKKKSTHYIIKTCVGRKKQKNNSGLDIYAYFFNYKCECEWCKSQKKMFNTFNYGDHRFICSGTIKGTISID